MNTRDTLPKLFRDARSVPQTAENIKQVMRKLRSHNRDSCTTAYNSCKQLKMFGTRCIIGADDCPFTETSPNRTVKHAGAPCWMRGGSRQRWVPAAGSQSKKLLMLLRELASDLQGYSRFLRAFFWTMLECADPLRFLPQPEDDQPGATTPHGEVSAQVVERPADLAAAPRDPWPPDC